MRGPRPRGAALRRVLTLYRSLSGRRYRPPAGALARELGCSHRTVYRDLAVLDEVGLPVPPPLRPEEYDDGDAIDRRYVPRGLATGEAR